MKNNFAYIIHTNILNIPTDYEPAKGINWIPFQVLFSILIYLGENLEMREQILKLKSEKNKQEMDLKKI